jgi:hypothetical protein
MRPGARIMSMAALLATLVACVSTGSDITNLDLYGERFVHLALELGQHDADYVDAYFGPEQWRRDATEQGKDLEQIRASASAAVAALNKAHTASALAEQRKIYLTRQFAALSFRARMLQGDRYTFDEQSRGLYDAVAPKHGVAFFQATLDELDRLLPGSGSVAARREAFRQDFVIDTERLDVVFKTAITECARRTRLRLTLPEDESFTVEYVTDKAWSAYNWFQGDARSVIQVNTDLPIHIDRAIDLACHEGYPGHHVYNTLLEQRLLNDLGWIEFSVFPLFSPIGPIAEGSANYGIVMAFPGDERIAYERDVLFALAGLDPTTAARYYEVEALVDRLSYAGNEAARQYIDGEIDADQAAAWLVRYALMSPQRAAQRVRFIDKYGAYVINYNLGRDLVAAWVESVGPDQDARWQRFEQLLSSPYLPSQLLP